MARPRKTDTEELIQLVDSYFTTEAAGDPSKLKCSMLEGFAARMGKAAKAYDFRRDPKVRKHIEELKSMVLNENGMQMIQGSAYKSLDIEKVLRFRRDPDELRKALGDLDNYWKQVYDRSVAVADKNREFQKRIRRLEDGCRASEQKLRMAESGMKESGAAKNKLVAENRYLRKMLRTYLYPALANEILRQENMLDSPDTEVSDAAKSRLVDGKFPSGLKEAVSGDAGIPEREDKLLAEMWEELERT